MKNWKFGIIGADLIGDFHAHAIQSLPRTELVGFCDTNQEKAAKLGGIFNYRYNDTLKHLKMTIEKGRFGTISYASVHVPWWRSDDYYKNSWYGTLKLYGGGH